MVQRAEDASAATAADALATGIDRVATAADVVVTQADRAVTTSERVLAEQAAGAAATLRDQTIAAAGLAGTTIYDDTAAGIAATSDTEFFLAYSGPGLARFRNTAGTPVLQQWYQRIFFENWTEFDQFPTPLPEGTIIATYREGYSYEIVTTDECYTTTGGLQVAALGDVLCPAQYGVVTGIGQSPAIGLRNVQRLNAMLSRAAVLKAGVSFPSGGWIEIANATEPMKIPSWIRVQGNRCIIQAQDDTGPIIVSKAWADNILPLGNGHVEGLIARGTLTDAEISTNGVGAPNSQDGIIVYEFFSHWTKCEAWRCRGRGIVVEESNSAGGTVGGTLVENRFEQCNARNCAGRGFDMAPDQLQKLTDGWLLDPIVGQPKGCTHEAIYLGQGSGWNVRGFHTYDGSPERAVVIARGYQTNIGDGYIETYTRTAVHLPEAQQNISLGNIGVRSNKVAHGQAAVIEVERSSSVALANVKIRSIQDENAEGGAHVLIRNQFGLTLPVALGAFQVKGDNAALVTLPTAADTWLSMPSQGVVIGRMTDVVSQHSLSYQGQQVMKGAQVQWGGAGAQSVTFTIPYLTLYHMNRKMVCDLTIFGKQNHTGPLQAYWTGKLLLSGLYDGGAFAADLVATATPVGFDVAPAVGTLTKTGTQSGTNPVGLTVQITFTPTASDGHGTASLLLGPTLGL
jgi:hypothetical protein